MNRDLTSIELSVIIPVFNEQENVVALCEEVHLALKDLGKVYEIILVNDGSTDGTAEMLNGLAHEDGQIKVIHLRRNFGQTAALQAGIEFSQGEVMATMDGDLQNDPADIPRMLAKFEEGFDLVHGWRTARKDTWLTRRAPSAIANWMIRKVTGIRVHDLGSAMKVLRREIAQELELCGEMHRFVPLLAHQRGARWCEIPVNHRPRACGRSKYGIGRTWRVLLDLVTVKYMLNYFSSPMKLFGTIGFLCEGVGLVSLLATVFMKIGEHIDMTGNPLLLLSVLSLMLGAQFLSLGLLGEVNLRIYYSNIRRRPYAITKLVGFDVDATDHQVSAQGK